MKNIYQILLLALIISPLSASAQTTHIAEDPEPNTRRCQNVQSALHENGDVVMVEYFGQWKRWSATNYSQNGGQNGEACGIERVVRLDEDQNVVWELKPSSGERLGFGKNHKITNVASMRNGNTVVASYNPEGREHAPTTITMVGPQGDVLWKMKNQQSPQFSMGTVAIGNGDEVFIHYTFTNYGYHGGKFQLPGGRVWKMGKNQKKSLIVRLASDTGLLLWEQAGSHLVSASQGELLALKFEHKGKGEKRTERMKIRRFSYEGKRLSQASTPWAKSEGVSSYIRHSDHLVLTTEREMVRSQRVVQRTGGLHVYDFKGNQVHSRELSDGSKLAKTRPGAPLRIISPTNCLRGIVKDYSCHTDAFDVLTLCSFEDKGKHSKLQIPQGRFDYKDFNATSTRNGIWLTGRSYYRSEKNPEGRAPSVTMLESLDELRQQVRVPELFVWTPLPAKPKANTLNLLGL